MKRTMRDIMEEVTAEQSSKLAKEGLRKAFSRIFRHRMPTEVWNTAQEVFKVYAPFMQTADLLAGKLPKKIQDAVMEAPVCFRTKAPRILWIANTFHAGNGPYIVIPADDEQDDLRARDVYVWNSKHMTEDQVWNLLTRLR